MSDGRTVLKEDDMNRLRAIRERKGMTPGQLSGKSGIPTRVLLEYEEGRIIPYAHLQVLAKALYVEPDDLVGKSAAPSQPKPAPRPPQAPPPAPSAPQGQAPQ